MWFDKNLDPLDIKTYAIIRSLSNKYGYCFATNLYISQTLSVSDKTARRSLDTLKKNGYLEIETERNGLQWQRRIYISDKFKKTLRKVMDDQGGGHTRPGGWSQVTTITNPIPKEEVLEKEKDVVASRLSSLLLTAIKKTVPSLKTPNIDQWIREIDKMLRLDGRSFEKIEDLILWLPKNEFWSAHILDAKKFRQKFDQLCAEMNKKSKTTINAQDNQNLANNVVQKFSIEVEKNYIQLQKSSLLFCYTGCWDEISFTDNQFKDKVLSRLNKMNLNIE
jgi:DNA-binding PadR family transcriptional regulator